MAGAQPPVRRPAIQQTYRTPNDGAASATCCQGEQQVYPAGKGAGVFDARHCRGRADFQQPLPRRLATLSESRAARPRPC